MVSDEDSYVNYANKYFTPEEIIDNLEHVNLNLSKKSNSISIDECQTIKELISDANGIVKKIIDSSPDKEDIILCKYDLYRNVFNRNLKSNVTNDLNEWQYSYNTILEWEEDTNKFTENDRSMFIHMLKNVDLLISVLRRNVCIKNKLDLERLHDILNNIDTNVCGTYNDTSNSKLQNESLKSKKYIDPYSNSTGIKLEPNNELPGNLNINVTEGVANTLNKNSWELISDSDIINNRPIGHTIGTIADTTPYNTSRVSFCNGKVVSNDNLSSCTIYETNLINALNGNPNGMIKGLEHSMHR